MRGILKTARWKEPGRKYDPYTGMAVIEQTYRDGVLHGPAKQYYENSQLHIDMTYENGIPQGLIKPITPEARSRWRTAWKTDPTAAMLKCMRRMERL